MAATTSTLGVALLLTLTSNATLLSLLLALRDPQPSPAPSSLSSSIVTDSAAAAAANSKADAGGSMSSSSSDLQNVPSSGLLQQLEYDSRNPARNVKFSGESSSKPVQKIGFLSRNLRSHGENLFAGTGGFFPGKSSGGVKGGRVWREDERMRKSVISSRRVRRQVRSTPLQRIDTGHHLDDVIASLTKSELETLDSNTVKILIPALVALESVLLRELEKLHDVSVHQELRLERLEISRLQQREIMEAANVIREEEYLLQRQRQKEALREQEAEENAQQDTTTTVIDFSEGDNVTSSNLQDGGDGSGSGDEPVAIAAAAVATSAPTSAVNNTESSENAIINHIYEIYSSLTSMEHKVVELGSSLSVVSSELYRQKSTLVSVQDKVEEIRRQQRTMVMRTAMHGFKLTDLEQFRGQAELLMLTTSSAVEQFEGKLEAFKDRVTAQQDEVQLMRNVFSRLEQSNNELRAADAYKAHDIQELKRGAQQVETRLNNLYHSLDRYVGNIRWDVKTYLDHVCSSNNLQC